MGRAGHDERFDEPRVSEVLEQVGGDLLRAGELLTDRAPHHHTQQAVAQRLGDVLEALGELVRDLTAQIADTDAGTLRELPDRVPQDTIRAAVTAGEGLGAALRTARRQAKAMDMELRTIALIPTAE